MAHPLQFEKALEALEHGLIAGRWQPGERVSLPALAEELDVSVTPVRDAVNELVSQGILERVNGVGTCVATPGLERLTDIWELRALLEGQAARWLAERASDVSFAALMAEARSLDERSNAAHQEYWRQGAGPTFKRLQVDLELAEIQFHHHFVANARSPELLTAWKPCYLLGWLAKLGAGIAEVYPQEIYEGHHRLVEVVARGDPPHAAQAAREHVMDPKERVVDRLYAEARREGATTAVAVRAALE